MYVVIPKILKPKATVYIISLNKYSNFLFGWATAQQNQIGKLLSYTSSKYIPRYLHTWLYPAQ